MRYASPLIRRDAGTTLLELVVALALFSTVALIGMQALRMSLRYQEELARVSTEISEVDYALNLLRHDLEAAQQLTPGRSATAVALPLRLGGVGALDAPGQSTQVEVLWSYDVAQRVLSRRRITAPEQIEATPILTGVSDFEFALLTPQGWEAPQAALSQPPRAYEVRLRTARGPLRILVVK